MFFEPRQFLKPWAFAGLGLLIIAALVAVYLGSAVSRSNPEVSEKCLPRHGIQICYPGAWEMQESKGNINIDSPIGEKPPFTKMSIAIGNKQSNSRIVTEEGVLDVLFDGKQTLDSIMQGEGSYKFVTPTKSNRHYGVLFVVGSKNGQHLAVTNERGELKFLYWRVMIGVLFPIDDGFLSIECTLESKNSGIVPVEQAEFNDSLIRTCMTLVTEADEK